MSALLSQTPTTCAENVTQALSNPVLEALHLPFIAQALQYCLAKVRDSLKGRPTHLSKKTAATAGHCCLCFANQSACNKHVRVYGNPVVQESTASKGSKVKCPEAESGEMHTLRMFRGPLGAVMNVFLAPVT